jgi:hypothetical protein
MKSLLFICRIFTVCFFVVYTFSSCSKYITVYNNIQVLKKVNIHITGFNTTTGELTMVDDSLHPATTFQAWPGQTIRWKIQVSGIDAIDSITKKPTNVNDIFVGPLKKESMGKTWKGTVKDAAALQSGGVKDLQGFYDFDYNMVWDSAGIKHTFDPRIQIR